MRKPPTARSWPYIFESLVEYNVGNRTFVIIIQPTAPREVVNRVERAGSGFYAIFEGEGFEVGREFYVGATCVSEVAGCFRGWTAVHAA